MFAFAISHVIMAMIGLGIFFALVVWPLSTILRRAGFNGWLSLLYFIPLVNLVMLWVFALSQWPALSEK